MLMYEYPSRETVQDIKNGDQLILDKPLSILAKGSLVRLSVGTVLRVLNDRAGEFKTQAVVETDGGLNGLVEISLLERASSLLS